MGRLEDISGQRFGRLVAKTYVGKSQWYCICDCGNSHYAYKTDLKLGKVSSCTCLKKELVSARSKTHGLSSSKEFKIWAQMHQRCYNTKDKKYYLYGKRGIKIYKRWHKFDNFYKDMGPKPKGLSIDRIDNDGDYKKSNCKWSTVVEQYVNRRSPRDTNGKFIQA